MNLPNSTKQKSLLLENLMSLRTIYGYEGYCLVYQQGKLIGGSIAYWLNEGDVHLDLYDEHNMALAWRAVTYMGREANKEIKEAFDAWWQEQWQEKQLQRVTTPAEAQRMWLDKVLELALDRNVVKAESLPLAV